MRYALPANMDIIAKKVKTTILLACMGSCALCTRATALKVKYIILIYAKPMRKMNSIFFKFFIST